MSFDAVSAGLPLVVYLRGRSAGPEVPLTVYIEGDGRAWLSRFRVSPDPTPREPVSFELSRADPSAPVAYVGRPCQFVGTHRPDCDQALWTDARYGDRALAFVDAAIDLAKRAAAASRLELVGYSGGGAIAALLAARRGDVELLVTVAGTLDTTAWTDRHRVTRLTRSYNPADVAERLAGIPQHHFVGEDDAIVMPGVNDGFFARLPRAGSTTVPGFDHVCCWAEAWPNLIREARAARE